MHIEIPGEPKGKARPRVCRNGITFTPKETVNYENWVKLCCRNVMADSSDMLQGELVIIIKAYFSIPKSTSKKKREAMLLNKIRPTKKPDIDNIVKIIADSLNNLAYKDDSQIVSVIAQKYYSDMPRVIVELEEII